MATRLVRAYYWATPVFVLLDLAFGINVRVPFLDAMPGLKWTYYACGAAIGIAMYLLPTLSTPLALLESSVNIVFLIVATMLAYYGALDAELAAPEQPHGSPFTSEAVINLLLAATVFSMSYMIHRMRMASSRRRPDAPFG
jgi:hypothetical protein